MVIISISHDNLPTGMAVWGRIPVTSLPAYVIGQFMGSLAASGLLLSIWWNVIAEVGPEVRIFQLNVLFIFKPKT